TNRAGLAPQDQVAAPTAAHVWGIGSAVVQDVHVEAPQSLQFVRQGGHVLLRPPSVRLLRNYLCRPVQGQSASGPRSQVRGRVAEDVPEEGRLETGLLRLGRTVRPAELLAGLGSSGP